jgi:large subunit ribosomal protein L4
MAVVDVLNSSGDKVSTTELNDSIFSVPVKDSVLHDVVKMQLAKKRAGSASVKGRSDVRGSGSKPFRQKGTGRARQGDVKSPLLKGGGVVFGPTLRDYKYKVPKKVRRLALKMALTSKLQQDELMVIDDIHLEEIKTKAFKDILHNLGSEHCLIISSEEDQKLVLSSRNLSDVKVLKVDGLNVYDILKYQKLILLEASLQKIEGRLLS